MANNKMVDMKLSDYLWDTEDITAVTLLGNTEDVNKTEKKFPEIRIAINSDIFDCTKYTM